MAEVDNESTHEDVNELIAQRRKKLEHIRQAGVAYPNDFKRDSLAKSLHHQYGGMDKAQLTEKPVHVKIAGRLMLRRIMGKATFFTLQDMSDRIQVYFKQNELAAGIYEQTKQWDLGDIIAVEGTLFKTQTDELTIRATAIRLLTKSLRPLPDKFHGLHDKELCYRQRYVDLMVNEKTRETFRIRSQVVNGIRNFLQRHDFLEVETPMMQVIPGGAAAKPFITHHNALDMKLYLRIAPELYLKRLVVGGLERVFEINRNFRNEGLSTRHNPEFTMLEFYQAYADYEDLMDLTEVLLRELTQAIFGCAALHYQGQTIDFSKPFARLTVLEAIVHFHPEWTISDLSDKNKLTAILRAEGVEPEPHYGLGKLQIELFEKVAEHRLFAPTFITAYPAEVSPLARKNDENPFVTDRFELFIAGREIANGFSELNDADDQAERFRAQVAAKDAGDQEAMHYDEDYITALEYGLPPTAGEGIGIDRLVMLFADSPSIRDVILFPHMRAVDLD